MHLLRIEADGYQPAISREFKNNEGNVTYDFALTKGRNLNVLVRLADGKPAAGAESASARRSLARLSPWPCLSRTAGFPTGTPRERP